MNVANYFYVKPNKMIDGSMMIEETLPLRSKYMSDVMWKLYKKDILDSIKPEGSTALLYIGGASEHHSHSRDYKHAEVSTMPVFSQMGYMVSKIAKRFDNIDYVSINSNACASSMYALYEAEKLLGEYDTVIIYGEEWVEGGEKLLFESLGIDIVCSDGFFVMQLDNASGGVAEISNTTWKWNPDKSPFSVSKDGYLKVIEPFKYESFDIVKTHGTGTTQNNEAEESAIDETFGCKQDRVSIKQIIGHTQGCSTGVELCMMFDENIPSKVLALASGLGSFYGSCKVDIHGL